MKHFMLIIQASLVVRMQAGQNIANRQEHLLKNICLEHILKLFCAKTNKREGPNKSRDWKNFQKLISGGTEIT